MPKSHLSWTPELRRARKQSRRYPIHYELLSMAHAELTPASKGVRPSLDTPDAVTVGNCDALVPVAGDTGNSDTLVKGLQSLQGQDIPETYYEALCNLDVDNQREGLDLLTMELQIASCVRRAAAAAAARPGGTCCGLCEEQGSAVLPCDHFFCAECLRSSWPIVRAGKQCPCPHLPRRRSCGAMGALIVPLRFTHCTL